SRSARMDLASAVTVMLFDTIITLIPMGVKGPLGDGLSALLLGRSSATHQRLFVLPSVIDADFMGEIQIMLWTPTPPCQIPEGSRVAQLLPFRSQVPRCLADACGEGCFCSTGTGQIMWAQKVSTRYPSYLCSLRHYTHQHEITLEGIIDTGADCSIIS
ncbi:hypothetical protein N301_07120, partial [Charadrius vociferus]